MKRVMDFLETRVVDVRVDLRGRDARMAEHFLYLAQVGAAGQKDALRMCGGGVWAQVRVAAG